MLILILLVWMIANYVALAGWWYGLLILSLLLLWRRHPCLAVLLAVIFSAQHYSRLTDLPRSIEARVAEVNQSLFSQQLSFVGSELRVRIAKGITVEPNCKFSGALSWRYRPAPEDYGNRLQRQQQLQPYSYSDSFVSTCPQQLTEPEYVAHPRLRALVLGHFNLLEESEVEQLQRSGTLHLFVVSGLHIGIIYLTIGWLSRRFFGLYTARCLSLAAIGGYLLCVVWGVAVGRVWLMILLAAVTWWLARAMNRYAILAAVALVLVLWSPGLLWRPGFWYSFSAVLCILLIYVGARGGQIAKVSTAQFFMSLLAGGVSQLPTNPFQSFAANVIVVPLWGLVVPAALTALIVPLTAPANSVEQLLQHIINWLPTAYPGWLTVSADWYLGLFIGCLYLAVISPYSLRLLACFILLTSWTANAKLSQIRVHDVGQGSALSVFSQGTFSLYDTGFGSEEFGAVIERTIWPLMATLKPISANYFLSHGDADHAGGLKAFRALLPAHRFDGEQLCIAGQRWQVGEARSLVLWPRYAKRHERNNGHSCAWLIELGNKRLLLLGDMSIKDELAMLRMWPSLSADVVVLAHHGSASSTSYALLSQLNPNIAIISAGQDNRFGHPSATVIHKLSQFGVKTLVTAKVGAITFSEVDDVELIRLSCLELISTKDCEVSVN